MNISILAPFTSGWNKMKTALFHPFNITTWFKVGFTAFLADLMEGGSSGSGSNYSIGETSFADVVDAPFTAWQWLMEHPLWFVLILMGLSFLFVLIVVLTWVSSRGKFMFLDNVVHSRALVTQPWKEFRYLANSLFLWRFVFGLIVLLILVSFFAFVWNTMGHLFYESDGDIPWFFLIQMGLIFLVLIAIIGYIGLMLDSFVIPVMYKHRITATRAWSRFLKLHWQQFGYFVLYALFCLLCILVIGAAVIAFGLFTCCLGFLLLAIPYISSVILLPITYTLRAFSVEYLAQYGEEWSLFVTAK